MTTVAIASIVEGHGEVEAVPVLLRRIVPEVAPGLGFVVDPPVRVRRDQVVKERELEQTWPRC